MAKLNIGCGLKKKEGYINIDKYASINPDRIVDIENGLPFPDDYFDEIFTQHCLEHIRPEYFEFVLDEMARVSKDGALWDIELPYDNPATRTCYCHYRTFNFMSFNTLLIEDQRQYYTGWRLKQLHKTPSKLTKLFFYTFPYFKKNIFYKFTLVKPDKNKLKETMEVNKPKTHNTRKEKSK